MFGLYSEEMRTLGKGEKKRVEGIKILICGALNLEPGLFGLGKLDRGLFVL